MKISSIIPLFAALSAVKAQINPGVYHIKSLAYNEVFVGRAVHEDRSLLPKRILLVNDAYDNAEWYIEPAEEDRYRLTIRGSSLIGGGPDDLLYAFLLDDNNASREWFITPVPQYGDNNYIVETPDRTKGWIAPNSDSEDKQLALKPLSDPASYPATEVFTFTLLDEE